MRFIASPARRDVWVHAIALIALLAVQCLIAGHQWAHPQHGSGCCEHGTSPHPTAELRGHSDADEHPEGPDESDCPLCQIALLASPVPKAAPPLPLPEIASVAIALPAGLNESIPPARTLKARAPPSTGCF